MKKTVQSSKKVCPSCQRPNIMFWPSRINLQICKDCNLIFQTKESIKEKVEYGTDYYDYWGMDKYFKEVRRLKVNTSLSYLNLLDKKLGIKGNNLLDIGCAYGFTLEAAKSLGLNPYGVEVSPAAKYAKSQGFQVFDGDLINAPFKSNYFDIITMLDVIEHIFEPKHFLTHIHNLLKQSGSIIVVTPDISSISQKILGNKWFHLKEEHVCYYSHQSMEALLEQTGFDLKYSSRGYKYLSLQYIEAHFAKYGSKHIAQMMHLSRKILPKNSYNFPLKFPTETIYFATKKNHMN